MLFNSYLFLLFFPVVAVGYYVLPLKFRILFLLFASCLFYITYQPVYIFVIFASILVNYFSAIKLSKVKKKYKKNYLLLDILANLLILGFFKYFNFFSSNIQSLMTILKIPVSPIFINFILPLGLSFHTFQGLSYITDVYKKKIKPEKNFLVFSLYIMFFPQLVAGPIERAGHMIPQFYKKHKFKYENIVKGLRLMLWGMFLKVVLADRIALFVDPVYGSVDKYNGLSLAAATILFAFQIYYDFLGYSTIAIGAAKIFGFDLVDNFDNPYTSKSIKEFWRKWHISLSSWFRDYVYIPLGGSRKGKIITLSNLIVTFLLCGLWHGANWTFILWGVINGIYLAFLEATVKMRPGFIKKIRLKRFVVFNKISSIIITFIFVCFAWIFFRAESISEAFTIIKRIGSTNLFQSRHSIVESLTLGHGRMELLMLLIFIIIAEYINIYKKKRNFYLMKLPAPVRWGIYCILLWLIILSGQFNKKNFIYYVF